MIALVRQVSLRHLMGERARSLLALLGIVLGVAVYVGIRIANESALAAFQDTVDAVAGRANLQVTALSGRIPDRLFPIVSRTPGVAAAAPIVETMAPTLSGRVVLVLGVDPFSEPPFRGRLLGPDDARSVAADGASSLVVQFLTRPHAVAVSQNLARALRLRAGSTLTLLAGAKPVRLRVLQVLRSHGLDRAFGGDVALMDVAAAQELFGKVGGLDRIDVRAAADVPPAVVAARLRRALPPAFAVESPRRRGMQVENMVGAFQLNLTALSFIAILVGAFIIYNSLAIAVLRRRREIGLLRSAGATRHQVLALFLAEAALFGGLGSVLGVLAGIGMARFALASVARTITELYVRVNAQRLVISPIWMAQGLALGMGASVAAALAPALEAAAANPVEAVREGALRLRARRRALPWLAAGLALLAVALALALVPAARRVPDLSFAGAFSIIGGFALTAPAVTVAINTLLARPVRRLFGVEGDLASRSLLEALDRTGTVVAAVMVSLAMLIGLSVMVTSFRRTVDLWIRQTIRADLFIGPAGAVGDSSAFLPPEVMRYAASLPGVIDTDTYRAITLPFRGKQVSLAAVDTPVLARRSRELFRQGDSRTILAGLPLGDRIIVSENFARLYGINEGDEVPLPTPDGLRRFRVMGVIYDYTSDAGFIMIDARVYARRWRDPRITNFALYVRDPSTIPALKAMIRRRFAGRYALVIRANRELRRNILRIFDQTFSLTYALELIAILVAAMGIANTLLALILQRGREVALLRAVGATREQVRRMIYVESGLIAVTGHLLGSVAGFVLSLELTYVINRQFFGWTIQLSVQPGVFAGSLALVVAAALLAAAVPARLAASAPPAAAMRLE